MIQYQYFHTGRQYVSKLSIDRKNSEYSSKERIFEGIRKGIEGDFFAYIVSNKGETILLQNTNQNEAFVVGLLENGYMEKAYRFIDKLPKAVQAADMEAEILPDGQLPNLGRMVDDFSLAYNLGKIFGKLVDALLYGNANKPIILITDSRDTSVKYIKVLSMLLPDSYMQRIGFCVGSKNIPQKISVPNDAGEMVDYSAKVISPELSNFNFETYSSIYYVFDVTAGRDNYEKTLSITGKVIDSLNFYNSAEINAFQRSMAEAFNLDGTVNLSLLEEISALYWFSMHQDIDGAKQVLMLDSLGAAGQRIQAIQMLLNDPTNVLSNAEEDKINLLYQNDNLIADAIKDSYFDYLNRIGYNSLSQAKKQIYHSIVSEDATAARLRELLERNYMAGDAKALQTAFSISSKILKNVCAPNDYKNFYECKNFVKVISSFFDSENYYTRIPEIDECLFATLSNVWNEDKKLHRLLAAALMAAIYRDDSFKELAPQRVAAMLNMLSRLNMSKEEKFQFILDVRNLLLLIRDEVPELGIQRQLDFLFDVRQSGDWIINNIIKGASVETALELNNTLQKVTVRERYESMENALATVLLNTQVVRSEIRNGRAITKAYINYFHSLPVERQNREIRDHISRLDQASDISQEFLEYRCSFVKDCYNTLSDAQKEQIPGAPEAFDEKVKHADRIAAVEKLSSFFGVASKNAANRRSSGKFSPVSICALLLSFLSALILMLPAFVQAAVLKDFSMGTIGERLNKYMVVVCCYPVAVYMLNLISYFKVKTNMKLRKSIIITLFCGVLPTVAFSLIYIILYFIGYTI